MSELKTMKTWFKLPVLCMPSDIGGWMEHVNFGVKGLSSHHCEAIEDAINNHDRLVEENQRLTTIATKHATRADELYETLETVLLVLEGKTEFNPDEISTEGVREVLDKSLIEVEKGDGICN